MKTSLPPKAFKAKKKILPALGGISKDYVKKNECLKTIILFMMEKISELEDTINLPLNVNNSLRQIEKDLKKISNFKKIKRMDFYFLCQSIIENY